MLIPGSRLGPYVIDLLLGKGGMGEVYRAHDSRLNRDVAIKILSRELSADPQFRQRFEREARAIAALEHPNICPLYDVGEADGMSFLVMPQLNGETLADLLRKGPVPFNRALHYAVEIATALEAAHRAGVVHRDVKPGNVMVTKSGVKLLDFGLARVTAMPPSIANASTMAASITIEGSVLGTLPYMSPEQLEGRPADARTDIFALGAIVYEMVTGRRPFEATSQAGLIAAIVAAEPPPISASLPSVPPSLDRVVKKCLAKDPDARWQNAGDLAAELTWVIEAAPVLSTPSRWAFRSWLLALALAAVSSAATWLLKPSAPAALPTLAHFILDSPPEASVGAFAFSRDGSRLIFVASVGGQRRLFKREIDQAESTPIAGTEGAADPFLSPNGRDVGFWGRGMLQRVSIDGGTRSALIPTAGPPGAAWGDGDQIVSTLSGRSRLVLFPAAGGSTREITAFDAAKGETSHRLPTFLPGGRAVLFTAGPPTEGSWSDADIVVQSLDLNERRTLIKGAGQARYVLGHLVYSRAGTLFAVAFDLKTLRVTGTSVAVLTGVRDDPSQGKAQFDVSDNGHLAYAAGGLRRTELVWVDRRGNATPVIRGQEPRLFYAPRLSPDGRQVSVIVGSGNDDVWIYDLKREVLSRFTSGANHLLPIWTPGGDRLTYLQMSVAGIVWRKVDGGSPEEVLVSSSAPNPTPHSWSPDSQLLVFTESGEKTGSDVWVFSVADRKRRPLIQSPFSEVAPAISPDGKWLAYAADDSGRFEVYVQPFPGGGRRVQISQTGGLEPVWSPDGKELFYRQDAKMMVAGGAPAFHKANELFNAPWATRNQERANFDVARDGQRFLMIRSPEPDDNQRIHVILNWANTLAPR